MMLMIEDHAQKDKTIRSKKFIKVMGQGSWPRGSGAKTPKKGGSGGGPKNRQILHTGGEIWGGGVFGGVPEQGFIKHEVL